MSQKISNESVRSTQWSFELKKGKQNQLVMKSREEHFKAKRAHLSCDHNSGESGESKIPLNSNFKPNQLVDIEIEEVLSFYG